MKSKVLFISVWRLVMKALPVIISLAFTIAIFIIFDSSNSLIGVVSTEVILFSI